MAQTITITVKDEYVDEINVVQEFCKKYDVSFSAFAIKAILASFIKGEGASLITKAGGKK